MNNKIANLIIFTAGAAIGSLVTWKLLKTKYEQIAQEEINSVKEVFARSHGSSGPKDAEEAGQTSKETIELGKELILGMEEGLKIEKPDLMEYAAKIRECGYANPDVEEPEYRTPYVISPDDVGELVGYDVTSINYFADQILADDDNDILSAEEVENYFGFEALSHFGEYEDDSVFVRNERLKTDFEILKNLRNYSDIVGKKPYMKTNQMEEE